MTLFGRGRKCGIPVDVLDRGQSRLVLHDILESAAPPRRPVLACRAVAPPAPGGWGDGQSKAGKKMSPVFFNPFMSAPSFPNPAMRPGLTWALRRYVLPGGVEARTMLKHPDPRRSPSRCRHLGRRDLRPARGASPCLSGECPCGEVNRFFIWSPLGDGEASPLRFGSRVTSAVVLARRRRRRWPLRHPAGITTWHPGFLPASAPRPRPARDMKSLQGELLPLQEFVDV